MASLIAKIFDFEANQPIPSAAPLDAEFQQIIDVLSGITTGTKLLVKSSDASDPVVELDQIGAGPLLELKQNGTLRALFNNGGNLTISNTAPEIVWTDTNNSKQMRIALDNTVWNFLNDTLASTALSMNTATDVFTFTQIPVGPASDPTADSQFARKKYVDDKSFWSANWFIEDPSTFPSFSFNLCQKVLIPLGNFKVRLLHIIANTGTASGSFSVELRKHPFDDQSTQTTIGTITLDPGTIGVGATVDVVDHEFTAGDWLYVILTDRSSPLQRNVTISAVGEKLGTV